MYSKRLDLEYSLDLSKYMTQPSISMAIFRSKYLRDDVKIPITRGHLDAFIREGYTGGHVEVYEPKIQKG
jgi:hypothetical protein